MAPRHLRPVVSNQPHNPYAGVGGGEEYDPKRFYTGATDAKAGGDRAHRRVQYPASLVAEIERMIQGGKLGGEVETFGDAARDALHHWAHRVAGMIDDGMFTQNVELVRRLADAESIERERQGQETAVLSAAAMFTAARMSEDVLHAERALGLYEPVIEGLREPYRSKLEVVLKEARKWVASTRKK